MYNDSMPKQKLHDLMSALQDELHDSGTVDFESREQLIQLRDDIENLLELSSEAEPVHLEAVRTGATTVLNRLEQRHPRFTRILGNILDALAGIGI